MMCLTLFEGTWLKSQRFITSNTNQIHKLWLKTTARLVCKSEPTPFLSNIFSLWYWNLLFRLRFRWYAHRSARARGQQFRWSGCTTDGFYWFPTTSSLTSDAFTTTTTTTVQLSGTRRQLNSFGFSTGTIQLQYSTISNLGSREKGFEHSIFAGTFNSAAFCLQSVCSSLICVFEWNFTNFPFNSFACTFVDNDLCSFRNVYTGNVL